MPDQRHWLLWTLLSISLSLSFPPSTCAQETYTNAACISATPSMNACAKRWDSIRTECTKANTLNTVWPGPCECAYFANDLPCFDDQALCAAQVWTQVPQWFRDGVSSCIMKDETYTIRAALGDAQGSFGNPFTVQDLPGKLTRTVDGDASARATGTPARTRLSAGMPSATSVPAGQAGGLSTGAKAGFGIGIAVGVVGIAIAAVLIARTRRHASHLDAEKTHTSLSSSSSSFPAELHHDTHAHHISSKALYPEHEMPGSEGKRHELETRASTWLVELPVATSKRNSRI